MEDVVPADWTPRERDLWTRIEAHDFEPPDQALHFTARLARDRGWTLPFARDAVLEYRRFCFLALVSAGPVTPSQEVDEVWHQHLTYSRDYWDRWCAVALRAALHHDPTRGGAAEASRYRAQYAETLALYEAYFGPPDQAFWPGTRQRFRASARYRTVDLDTVLVVACPPRLARALRRAGALLGLAAAFSGLATEPASALPLNPLDWTAKPFLTLYIVLAGLALAAAWTLRNRMYDAADPGQPDNLDVLELAYLAGGPSRAADAVMIGFLEAGAAAIDQKTKQIVVDARGATLPPAFEPFRHSITGSVSRAAFVGAAWRGLQNVKAALARRHLVPAVERDRRVVLAVLGLIGPVLMLGLLKVMVGLSRDKPVGFLVFLLMLTGFGGAWLAFRPKSRTSEGDAALADHLRRYSRALRAPRPGEVMLAFALLGAEALIGTEMDAYAAVIRSSASNDSGGGCGGGGGGGGGCGGCGA